MKKHRHFTFLIALFPDSIKCYSLVMAFLMLLSTNFSFAKQPFANFIDIGVSTFPSYTRIMLESKNSLQHHISTLKNPDRLLITAYNIDFTEEQKDFSKKISSNDPFVKSMNIWQLKPGITQLELVLNPQTKFKIFQEKPVDNHQHLLIVDLYSLAPPKLSESTKNTPDPASTSNKPSNPPSQVATPSTATPALPPSPPPPPPIAVPSIPPDQISRDKKLAFQAEADRDYVQSFALWKKLSDTGDGQASNRLAFHYLNGWNVPIDINQAAIWFEKAIKQNYIVAKYSYGRVLMSGFKGTPVNAALGKQLIRESIISKDPGVIELLESNLLSAQPKPPLYLREITRDLYNEGLWVPSTTVILNIIGLPT